MTHPPLDEIRRDLAAFAQGDVVLFGSVATGEAHARSDIDVAIVTREPDRARNLARWEAALGAAPDRYDVRVFELLPLPVQAEIVEHHVMVFGDALDLSEYFYETRKRWRDVAPRVRANQFRDVRERLRALGLR